MRIDRIGINNFAAVRNLRLEPTGITVIHGPNESLKTMILDSMLLTLFSQVGFSSIRNRYSTGDLDNGDVSVSVSMNNGQQFKFTLGGKDNLAGVLNLPKLSARNLMVVRTGELGFHEESGWWGSIRDNLIGFEGGLGRVAQFIRNDVGLTPKGGWTDTQERPIKSKIGELEEGQEVLEAALRDAEIVGSLEAELGSLQRDLQNCREALDGLRAARERDKYLEASQLRGNYDNKVSELKNYQRYGEKDYQEWLDAQQASGNAQIRLNDLRDRQTDLRREIQDKSSERNELSRKIVELEGREVNVFAGIERLLVKIESKREEMERASLNERPLGFGSAIASAAAGIFLYFALSRGGLYFAGLAGSAVAALFLWKGWSNHRGKRLSFARLKRDLLDQIRPIFPGVGDVEEIRRMLDEQRRVLNETKGKYQNLETDIAKMNRDLGNLGNNLYNEQNNKRAADARVNELQKNTGCSTHQQLRGKLDRKRQLEIEIESHRQQANQILGVSSEGEWSEALKKLEMYKDAQGVWNQQEYDRLKQMLGAIEQSLEDIRNRFQSARDAIIRAGCSTPEDVFIELDGVVGKLEEYRLKKAAALAAIGALDDMAAEQDTIINSVIGDGPDSAQAYFESITGGKYSEVFRDGDVVRTRMPDGTEFSIEQLSTGTQAQLYFALRVSLINKIFVEEKNEPPLLLLDDPFLSADEGRRETVMDFLIELAKEGWQIIYFTVDSRVPDMLQRVGDQLFSLVSLPPA